MLSDELMTDEEEESEQQQILKVENDATSAEVSNSEHLLDVSLSSIGLDFVSVDE